RAGRPVSSSRRRAPGKANWNARRKENTRSESRCDGLPAGHEHVHPLPRPAEPARDPSHAGATATGYSPLLPRAGRTVLRRLQEFRRPPAREPRPARDLFPQFTSLPFDVAAADAFGRLRAHLESLGTPIGPYDLQIASIALVHQLIVVTHNVAEF